MRKENEKKENREKRKQRENCTFIFIAWMKRKWGEKNKKCFFLLVEEKSQKKNAIVINGLFIFNLI